MSLLDYIYFDQETDIFHSLDVFKKALDPNGRHLHEDHFHVGCWAALGEFYRSSFDDYTDVRLSMKDGCLRAHRVILASQSPFFSALLSTGSHWSISTDAEASISLPDISSEIMKVILNHLYSGSDERCCDGLVRDSPEALKEMLVDLLAASNHLLLDQLKNACERLLQRMGESPSGLCSLIWQWILEMSLRYLMLPIFMTHQIYGKFAWTKSARTLDGSWRWGEEMWNGQSSYHVIEFSTSWMTPICWRKSRLPCRRISRTLSRLLVSHKRVRNMIITRCSGCWTKWNWKTAARGSISFRSSRKSQRPSP